MKWLPKLVFYKADPNWEPWLFDEGRTAEYNPETNKIRIYYAPKTLPIPNQLRRFKILFHEFIHWLTPSYKSKYGYYFILFHVLNDFFNKIIDGLISRDRNWIFIDRETKGVKEVFSQIAQHHNSHYLQNVFFSKRRERIDSPTS